MKMLTNADLTPIVSIIVSAISLIGVILTARKNAKASLNIEQIRSESAAKIEQLRNNTAQEIEKIKKSSTLELENIKFEIEERKRSIQTKQDNNTKIRSALDHFITLIQVVKDYIYRYNTCVEESFFSTTAIDQTKTAVKDYIDYYDSEFILLQEKEKNAAHQAKNMMINFETLLIKFCGKNQYLCFSEQEKSEFKKIRTELTEYQNILRDKRIELTNK